MMATITVDDEVYDLLTKRAAVQRTTVDALTAPVLAELVHKSVETPPIDPATPIDLPYEEWKARLDDWMAVVEARADRYPPGFEVDCSYEAIYGDR